MEYFSTSLSECHSVVWGDEVALVFSFYKGTSFAHLHDCPVGDSAVPRHAVEVEVAVQVVVSPADLPHHLTVLPRTWLHTAQSAEDVEEICVPGLTRFIYPMACSYIIHIYAEWELQKTIF